MRFFSEISSSVEFTFLMESFSRTDILYWKKLTDFSSEVQKIIIYRVLMDFICLQFHIVETTSLRFALKCILSPQNWAWFNGNICLILHFERKFKSFRFCRFFFFFESPFIFLFIISFLLIFNLDLEDEPSIFVQSEMCENCTRKLWHARFSDRKEENTIATTTTTTTTTWKKWFCQLRTKMC